MAILIKQEKQKTLKVTKLLQQGNCNAEWEELFRLQLYKLPDLSPSENSFQAEAQLPFFWSCLCQTLIV